VTHLRFDVEMVELEYGMEFEYLFGVPDEIPDITRSSGMVRRIRFIYRKSYSKFGNDPVHLWQVLEGSRKVRKKSPWKVESRRDSTLHGQPTLKGRSPRWTPLGWPANPPQGKVGVPPWVGLPP
jgi:hypothetical protein